MNRKKTIWIIILLAAAGVAWYAYKEYTRPNKDFLYAKPDYILTAGNLIYEYESNDSSANKKYNGKIVEVSGPVKKIEKDERDFYTLVLGDSSSPSSVRCSMDTTHQSDAALLVIGSSAVVRGACTGFNKDEMGLGSDVILNRCAIINKKD
jgi:tRNA_anti-like